MALIEGPMDPKRCSATVADHTGFHWFQCSRKAVMTRDGKGWCKQHDPERIKAQRDASMKKWEERSRQEMRPHALAWHAAKLAEALQGVLDAWKSTTDSSARQNARKALAEYIKELAA